MPVTEANVSLTISFILAPVPVLLPLAFLGLYSSRGTTIVAPASTLGNFLARSAYFSPCM